MIVRASVRVRKSRAVGGVRSLLSRMIRSGSRPSMPRTVSCGSSASTVPMPTSTASQIVAQRHHLGARERPGDPLRLTADGRDLAVERDRRLERELRATFARPRQERAIRTLARRTLDPDGDLEPRATQHPDPTAMPRHGVRGPDHHARQAGIADDRCTRRRPPVVGARLEVDVERGAVRRTAELVERDDLRMPLAGALVGALREHLPIGADDHAADHRVRGRPSVEGLGELEAAKHVPGVTGQKLGRQARWLHTARSPGRTAACSSVLSSESSARS